MVHILCIGRIRLLRVLEYIAFVQLLLIYGSRQSGVSMCNRQTDQILTILADELLSKKCIWIPNDDFARGIFSLTKTLFVQFFAIFVTFPVNVLFRSGFIFTKILYCYLLHQRYLRCRIRIFVKMLFHFQNVIESFGKVKIHNAKVFSKKKIVFSFVRIKMTNIFDSWGAPRG